MDGRDRILRLGVNCEDIEFWMRFPEQPDHLGAKREQSPEVRGHALELVVGDANQMPFPAGSFNAVLAIDNAHFWADRPGALQRIRQVVDGAPGSLVLALSPQSGGSAWAVIRDLDRADFEVDYHNESSNGFLIRATAT